MSAIEPSSSAKRRYAPSASAPISCTPDSAPIADGATPSESPLAKFVESRIGGAWWVAQAIARFGLNRSNVVPLAVVATALVAAGDFLTGIEITFTLLYLVPITMAAWFRGRVFGAALAIVSAAIATATDIVLRQQNGRPVHAMHVAWNHGGSLVIFIAFGFLVARLRRYHEHDRQVRRATLEQLRQADRLGIVGQLAAGIAHELGTPLNVIVGHAELIDSEYPSRQALRRSSKAILAQAEKMARIIRGLLDFSRRGGAAKGDVDLDALVESAASLVRPIAAKNTVALDVRPASADVTVHGNRTELEQVLVNLMVNAIHAMPHGGSLRVQVRTEPRRGSSPPMACIEVEDEGVGIPAENLPRIFDPFFTTKDVGSGTGLGLSISYGIVADHQGRIVASSVVGSGSRFSVMLPQKGSP
jgi:signal transduction histidine kinase